ncbi:hypothetical protein AXYL_03768 [Achromobacter xylosoxidans A8]|uniref:ASCH domain-containing protein n=1 Tax=Achromobacter xylosoxidans (strain A8) TaxID=762376 RepID=E3HNP9_ACHXA|nr:hypothetical protein AXYL_03768 [Achromobacter xylosoxidans A8]
MSLFPESSPHPSGRVVLLSIKPKYADLILAGSKRVEFRRSWAAQDVSAIVLYSSSPIRKIVGVVEVLDSIVASPSSLWMICRNNGGGLTRADLRSYFANKSKGVAVLLGKVLELPQHLEPSEVIKDFAPPQSFRYMASIECMKLEEQMKKRKGQP